MTHDLSTSRARYREPRSAKGTEYDRCTLELDSGRCGGALMYETNGNGVLKAFCPKCEQRKRHADMRRRFPQFARMEDAQVVATATPRVRFRMSRPEIAANARPDLPMIERMCVECGAVPASSKLARRCSPCQGARERKRKRDAYRADLERSRELQRQQYERTKPAPSTRVCKDCNAAPAWSARATRCAPCQLTRNRETQRKHYWTHRARERSQSNARYKRHKMQPGGRAA